MGRGVSNPEYYCPICGERFGKDHECEPATLSQIDAARLVDRVLIRTPTMRERLKDGFDALSDDENANISDATEQFTEVDPSRSAMANEQPGIPKWGRRGKQQECVRQDQDREASDQADLLRPVQEFLRWMGKVQDKVVSKVDVNRAEKAATAARWEMGGQVTEVRLTDTEVSDARLKRLNRLKSLRVLDLSGSNFNDAGLEGLKGMTGLQFLNLSATNVTDVGSEHLKGLFGLKALHVGATRITDAGLENLKKLARLQDLRIGDTNITDAGLVHLNGLTNLRCLVLNGTNVSDAGLEHLRGFKSLQRLELTGTKISDAGLAHLTSLTKLKYLDLWKTNATNARVERPRQALRWCDITHP